MFTLGIDYGTNSVRALVVRCKDGKEFGTCIVNYPSGTQGVLLDPRDHNVARQHPGDYLFGLQKAVKGALAQAKKQPGFSADKVIGLQHHAGAKARVIHASDDVANAIGRID